jgi:hypothetical protein
MRARFLTLLCFSAITLVAASAQAQVGSTSPPGSTTTPSSSAPGTTTGMSNNAPGTNSVGTAQSSGRGGGGQGAASVADDPALKDEDRKVDRTIKSTICRGC